MELRGVRIPILPRPQPAHFWQGPDPPLTYRGLSRAHPARREEAAAASAASTAALRETDQLHHRVQELYGKVAADQRERARQSLVDQDAKELAKTLASRLASGMPVRARGRRVRSPEGLGSALSSSESTRPRARKVRWDASSGVILVFGARSWSQCPACPLPQK